MPKRTDIKNILIIGSGPIVIGQGCEFDYSGTQACKALREEGYSVVLINSNPATIMTDPSMADRTYIEPITPEFIEKVLAREKADGRPVQALLPTLGGQTGLNCAMEVAERGVLERYGVEMIGASREAIHRAEDRTAFKETVLSIGLEVPRSDTAHTWNEALAVLERIGLPCCVRPAYTLGGEGGGYARTQEDFERIARRGLAKSRVSEILIEEDLYGWKEFELEVMRDRADNVVIICTIENLDPMGVHTGDSITVAPAQTLSDKEYQKMRDGAVAIIRAIGVDTGGCNIQFAVDPRTGRQVVIEMNPRVSRSSALASKATGYPIARVAAKLAVGYTLDELPNDITGTTPASVEPTIDYCVVKIPRWTFEKFPDGDETLTTHMKSVGEGMAIGRTFKEAFQKCIRSMEIQRFGYGLDRNDKSLRNVETSKPENVGTSKRRNGGTAERENVETSKRRNAETEERGNVETSKRRNEVSHRYEPPAQARGSPEVQGAPSSLPRGWGTDARNAGTSALGGMSAVQAGMSSTTQTIGGVTQSEAPPDTEEAHARVWPIPLSTLRDKLSRPCQGRPYYIRYAFKMGWTVEQVHELTRIDPWFLENMYELAECEAFASSLFDSSDVGGDLAYLRQRGYTAVQLGNAAHRPVRDVANRIREHRIAPVYKLVDTCAGEFEARTPYYYSTHESPVFRVGGPAGGVVDDEVRDSDRPKIVVLGGGPNRIGQGIEFDYCCCHASYAARKAGFESVMINSNPETVSTDFDTSDMLFFEPLTHEDVRNVIQRLGGGEEATERRSDGVTKEEGKEATERRSDAGTKGRGDGERWERGGRPGLVRGVIVQFGGQTPLNLAQGLKDVGVPILGTQPEMIHLAEDREKFQAVLRELSLLQPPSGIARSPAEARLVAERIGYPVLVRPSYVLGGRGMRVCNNEADLQGFLGAAFQASDRNAPGSYDRVPASGTGPVSSDGGPVSSDGGPVAPDSDLVASDRGALAVDNPILIDKFLADAIEVDVDAVADFGRSETDLLTGETVVSGSRRPAMCLVAGIMEHIEECGIHSGDSTCTLPPFSLGPLVIEEIFRSTMRLARRLNVCGAMNVQYAVLNRTVYVLEVNPRASRTLPFVAKATGVPWAEVATRVMLGEPLATILGEYGVAETPRPRHTSIKAPVFPFDRFHGVDVILGPEMRSTGEVMAIDSSFGRAFAKAQIATGRPLPTEGNVLISVNDPDKPRVVSIARDLYDLGFTIYSTTGTRAVLAESGIASKLVSKSSETGAPFLKDLIEDGTLHLLINTPIRTGPSSAEGRWRAAAESRRIPLITTLAGARAAVSGIRALRKQPDGPEVFPLSVNPLQAYYTDPRN